MRPIIRNIAYKHTLNLSSTLFRTRPSLRTTHLLSLGKCHTSTTSKIIGEDALRQARAKQWYEHLHTKFHTINGYTSPTFKILLADIARRAGHTVSEGDGAANPRWDRTDDNPILKLEAELSTEVAKSAGNSVNDDDGVIETGWDGFENHSVLSGEAGYGKRVVEEDNSNDNERDVESEDREATDDESITEIRLDQYLEALVEDGVTVTKWDWFENNPVLKGEADDGKGVVKEEINNNERDMEGADGKAMDDEDVTENRLDQYLEALEEEVIDLLEQVRMLKRGETEIGSTTRSTKRSLGGSCGTPIPKSCVLNRLKNLLMTG